MSSASQLKKNVLISSVGIREKFFSKLLDEIVIQEAIEFSNLVGGYEHFERTERIERIFIPDSEDLFKRACGEIRRANVIIYLGRKNSIKLVDEAVKNLRKNENKIILVNEKKFGRNGFIIDLLKDYASYFISRLNQRKDTVDYLITSSRSKSIRQIYKLKPKNILDCCYFDCIKNLENSDVNVGLYLDSFLPFNPLVTRKCGEEFKFDPDKYYLAITNFLSIIKEEMNVEKILVKRHPNSDGSELRYFKNFDILPLETRITDIKVPKFCCSSGSDAIIPFHTIGLQAFNITPVEAIRCDYYKNYYYSKSASHGIDNIVIDVDGLRCPNKENYIRSIYKSLSKKMLIKLHIDCQRPSSVDWLKKIL